MEALRENPGFAATAARLQAAWENYRVQYAPLFPTVNSGFNVSRNKRNSTAGFRLTTPRTDNFNLSAAFNWELDLWGKLRNRARAARQDYLATEADYHAARLSLTANIARGWYNVRQARLQLDLARRTLENFQNNLAILEAGFEKGVQPALDVRLSRGNVAGAESDLAQQERLLDAAIRSLETLLGRYPSRQLENPGDFPQSLDAVPAGLPSDLLRRRPDLLAAEARYLAAAERTDAARKDLLPSFSITASGGTNSDKMRNILDPMQNVWNLATGISMPVFQGGRLMRSRDRAKAAQVAAWEDYRQVALEALREVETALAAERWLAEQVEAQARNVGESIEAENLAWSQYQRGLTQIITVLEAQRRSVNAQASWIQLNNARMQNRISLYLALGGSFESQAPAEPAETTQP